MLFVKSVIFSVGLVLMADAASLAQLSGLTLHGTVRMNTAIAPAGVVRVQLQKFGVPIQVTFLRESRFEFSNIEQGHYTLVVDAPGYKTAIQDIEVPGEWPVVQLRPQENTPQPAEAEPVWNLKIPKSARRQFDAAKSKLVENKWAEALDHLKRAIQSYPEYGDAHKAMGVCYAQMNQLEMAEQEFKLALEQPHMPELHVLLGNIYALQGNPALQVRQIELFTEEKTYRR